MNVIVYLVPVFGIIALLYTAVTSAWVTKQDAGDANMKELAGFIAKGAMAFLKAEWRILGIFVALSSLLYWLGRVLRWPIQALLLPLHLLLVQYARLQRDILVCELPPKPMYVPHKLPEPA